jgi:hypothetical protein
MVGADEANRTAIEEREWEQHELFCNPLPASLRKFVMAEVACKKEVDDVVNSCFQVQPLRYKVFSGLRFSKFSVSKDKMRALRPIIHKYADTLLQDNDALKRRVAFLEGQLADIKKE